MSKKITQIEVLTKYLMDVIERAEHHAENVKHICLAVMGAIIWKQKEISVNVRNDEMKNVLWLRTRNRYYFALTYNHDNGSIDIKENTLQGQIVITFNNKSTLKEIYDFFSEI